jgi:hypothetical protein
MSRLRRSPCASSISPWAFVAVALLLSFSSCRLTDHSENDPDAITPDVLDIPASGQGAGDPSEQAAFRFDSLELDMGRIAQGAQVERSFHFTNSGKRDLIITDVRGTCGCTVGKDWPRTPIHPGKDGTITVRFDSEGRGGAQRKTVTVIANTQPPTTILTLKGMVMAPPGSTLVE